MMKSTQVSNRRRRLLTECLEDRRLLAGPYAPAAGEIGSLAIENIDPAFVAWASAVTSYLPGAEVDATFQVPANALGPAEGTSSDAVSLGRGGTITLEFDSPIRDGLGADFAVFENSFSDTFLELAFVEVSSDGVHFFRFENDSLTDVAVGSFGSVDPTNIHNLAGKYRRGFGTPFDLEELSGISPLLNTAAVTHVRVVDIFGDGSVLDTSGDAIYDPTPTFESAGFDMDGVGVLHEAVLNCDVVDFEDVGANLGAQSAFYGPVPNGTAAIGPYQDNIVLGQFESEELKFSNAYSFDFDSWNQWAYSNSTNTVTPGYTNQFSVFAGSGAGGSDTFAVGFMSQEEFYEPPTITRDAEDLRDLKSLKVANTTYAALSMLNGDSFAKKFGGSSGNDPDFLLLTIEGKDANDSSLGTIEVYLADFRFVDNTLDYIVDDWLEVDLGSLSAARSLEFFVSSSDVGPFGINTPTYFAIDDIALSTPVLSLDIADSMVSEDAGSQATIARVSRADNDRSTAIDVEIASLDPLQATAPNSVTIPAGAQYAEFAIGVIDNSLYDGDRQVVIEATSPGFIGASETLLITDDDPPALALSLAASSVTEGDFLSATISRNDADLASPLSVQITSPASESITFSSTVVIAAGQSSANFVISAVEDDVDRATIVTTVSASASDYGQVTQSLEIEDNDAPAIFIEMDATSYSEEDAFPSVGFEDVGTRLAHESFENGAELVGQFTSGGLQFNNAYSSAYWEGWSFSNTSDTTTPGYLNQYSAITGSGSLESDTYAVASAFGSILLPKISRDPSTAGFASLEVTNTTYAALSMRQGDSFSKKFGGDSGNDPDYFILTIEGFGIAGNSIGTIEFPLADFRFADNSLDYIIDQWTTIDLSSIEDAVELEFSVSSSDVGSFGINTPAYFAIDGVAFRRPPGSPLLTVSRNTEDTTSHLVVQLESSDRTEAIFPSSALIPSGESSVSVPWQISDDSLVDGTQSVTLLATADLHEGASSVISVTDDDQRELTLTLSPQSIGEAGGELRAVVHRNVSDVSRPLVVSISANQAGQLQLPTQLLIPAGHRSAEFFFSAVDNDVVDDDRWVQIGVAATGFTSTSDAIMIVDDDVELMVEINPGTLSEADGPLSIQLEDVGATIGEESFYNGADLSGGFQSGNAMFNNEYDTVFSSWSGWAVSNTTDTVSAGYVNQYSAFTGGGASQSATYAVANAYPGALVPMISVVDGSTFSSLLVTNTTYSALSMLEGDSFAKKFGGASGDDPDFFLLQIEGIDAQDQSIGIVDFYLADYRFEDNSLDYVIDQWATVDVSSLNGAAQLAFHLSSSDNGDFGMNTPAYFALDQIVFAPTGTTRAFATISRSDEDLSSDLSVALINGDPTELSVPSSVVIPSGLASIDVPLDAIDDAFADGSQVVTLQASAPSHVDGSAEITIEDDDLRILTLSLSTNSVSESAGNGAVELLLHRNDEHLDSPLRVTLASESGVEISQEVTIPAGSASVAIDVVVVDNVLRDGDRTIEVSGDSAGYFSSPVMLEISDDERSGLVVVESETGTVVTEAGVQDDLRVTLPARPLTNVFVDVVLTSSEVTADRTRLTFTPEDWNLPQTVMLAAVPDLVSEEDEAFQILFRIDEADSDPLFVASAEVELTVLVQNYEPPNLTITEDQQSIFLVDDDTGVQFLTGTHAEGLHAILSDVPQNLLLETLEQTTGSVQVATQGSDDVVEVTGTNFLLIDGGQGYDQLVLNLDDAVEFISFIESRVVGFEEYSLRSDSLAKLMIDLDQLSNSDQELLLRVEVDQEWEFRGSASYLAPVMIGSEFAQVIAGDQGQVQVISDTPWQNAYLNWDVNQSGDISGLDALNVINQLSRVTDPMLLPITSLDHFGGFYFDVTGDNLMTALDALQVINEISRVSASEGEAIYVVQEWSDLGSKKGVVDSEAQVLSAVDREITEGKLVICSNPNDLAIQSLYPEDVSSPSRPRRSEEEDFVFFARQTKSDPV